MTKFNPDVPDLQDPDYLDKSRGITQPEYKSVAAIGLTGAGDLIESGIKGADEVVKASAREDTRNIFYPEREAHLQERLAQAKLLQSNKTTLPPGGGEIDPAALPSDLKKLPGVLATLDAAKDNGKLSDTDYDGRMAALAKNLRAKYPVGYSEYIDEQVKKITGEDPAIAAMKSALSDVNSFLGNKDKDKEHLLRMAEEGIKHGMQGPDATSGNFMGANTWHDILASPRGNDPRVQSAFKAWYTENMKWKFKNEELLSNLNVNKQFKDFSDTQWKEYSNHNLDMISTGYFRGMQHFQDALPGITKDEQGNITNIDGTSMQALNRQIQDQRILAYNQMKNFASDKKLYEKLGPEAVEQMIQGHLKIFDFASENMTNDKNGRINWALNMGKSIKENEKLSLYRDKDLGWVMRKLEIFHDLGGDEGTKQFFQNQIGKGLPASVTRYMTIQNLDLRTADPVKPIAIKQMFDQARVDGITLPHYFDQFLGVTKDLVNPAINDQSRLRIALSIANPANNGLINDIVPDRYENGKYIPGKYSAWKRLTDTDIAHSMMEMDNKFPQYKIFEKYEGWALRTSAKELLGDSLKTFNDLLPESNVSNTKIWYSDKSQQFTLQTDPALKETPANAQFKFRAQKVIDDINSNLKGISNVATEKGVDPNKYIFSIFKEAGVDPERMSTIPGLSGDLIRAMKTTAEQKVLENEGNKEERARFGFQ